MMKIATQKRTMMKISSTVYWSLLIFIAGNIILLHNNNCNVVVTAQSPNIVNCTNSDRLVVSVRGNRRPCSFFASRQSFCDNIDTSTGQLVGKVCAKECPRISGCNGGIPPGPYVSVSKSSEVVTIPRPKLTFVDDGVMNSTNCPHKNTINLKLWHDVKTWGTSRLPISGENVALPSNTRVLIDRTVVESLGIVTIPITSELIIGSSNSSGILITAHGFNVYGKLIAGSEMCHISTPITITLTGKRPDDVVENVPLPEIKGISVNGGQLLLHGKRYTQTWSRLSKTVTAGSKVILLQEYVNWSVGQQIVLITSSMKDSRDYNQNEILTIEKVNNNNRLPAGVGSIVYVKEVVKYNHTANSGYQVEVGLLSRTITIQGDDQSEPIDIDPGNCIDPSNSSRFTVYYNTTKPCMEYERTGYGGHIMIHNNGIGQIEGVQLYRMGQTNVLGRYPMHYHLLNNTCPLCYFNANSIHHSFYRCLSIHGTNNIMVSENVAYDIIGYCYYLESGIEINNTISYNLAAHIHTLGDDIIRFQGFDGPKFIESNDLIIPADVTASGYYITNLHNNIIGNAASGGWSGFHFPALTTPIGNITIRSILYRPMNIGSLLIDGNTAHSSGWWWINSSPFYFGGALVYDNDGKLNYFSARTLSYKRDTCTVNPCTLAPYYDCGRCLPAYRGFMRITNSKAFLTAGAGLTSWNGRIEVIGYEAYDFRLAFQAFAKGVWVDNMLAVCRSGTPIDVPSKNVHMLQGNGIIWYDTNQKHIITDSKFRNCGYRINNATTLGCYNDPTIGCRSDSRTFGYLSDSNAFTPELMHGTRNISFDNCDTINAMETFSDAVSGRNANWLDVDGTISGLNEPTLIGSGVESAKNWWGADEKAVYQWQLRFIKKNDGPQRNLGFFRVTWNSTLQSAVGSTTLCSSINVPCPYEGFVRHKGKMFSPYDNPGTVNQGLPLTARADVVGPTGGYGWIIDWNKTAPRSVVFKDVEVDPDTVMLISIPYPINTTFVVNATSALSCFPSSTVSCTTQFTKVSSIDEVRNGLGDTYHVDPNGVLTFRLAQIAQYNTGRPTWSLPDYTTPSRLSGDTVSLSRFERDGVRLPFFHFNNYYQIQAKCPSDTTSSPTTGNCREPVAIYDDDVCLDGYVQTAYDKCCLKNDKNKCMFSDGSKNFN